MDHHVHAAITDGAAPLDDEELLARATQLGRVLSSQGEDLLTLIHRWLQTGRALAGLVYAQQLGVTIGQAIRDLG
jgi:hypothetical protein